MNLPNEPGSWDADFSYGYLERLYAILRRDFVPMRLGDAEGAAARDRPLAFVRHDLDVSLARALPLARKEAAWGVPSTYHVMIDSPFYDYATAECRAALAEIASLGHEIGLHYDVVARRTRDATSAEREADIDRACAELEAVVGQPVRSLSFHLPVPELIRGPLRVAGRISGYAAELFGWYLSDSRARWREGEPLASLAKPRSERLQILIHPIWWDEEHLTPAERLRGFIHEIAPLMKPPLSSYAAINERLWQHIVYRAPDEEA